MDEARLREEICRVGASLYERGYVHATAGNISARLDDGFLITPTDACLGFLDPARLARVEASGVALAGDPPSKTLALHRRIYEADAGARCVIHTHSTHLVALTLAGVWHPDDILPPVTPYYVMKVGHVPLIPYHRPGDPKVAEAGVGGRDEETVVQPHADVAGRGMHVAALEQAAADTADFLAELAFIHSMNARALVKNSSAMQPRRTLISWPWQRAARCPERS